MSPIPALTRKPRTSRHFKAATDLVSRHATDYPAVLATWINHLHNEGLLTFGEAQALLSRLPEANR